MALAFLRVSLDPVVTPQLVGQGGPPKFPSRVPRTHMLTEPSRFHPVTARDGWPENDVRPLAPCGKQSVGGWRYTVGRDDREDAGATGSSRRSQAIRVI